MVVEYTRRKGEELEWEGNKINGQTVKDLLDDYSGRDREIQKCKKYLNDEQCDICDADRVEMEKIINLINLAISFKQR